MPIALPDQDVDMVRHHHPGDEIVFRAMMAQETLLDAGGVVRMAQRACAQSTVERSIGAPMALDGRGVLRMDRGGFAHDACNDSAWQRIGETERDRLEDLGLIEVRV